MWALAGVGQDSAGKVARGSSLESSGRRIDLFLFLCTNLKSKWIKELHIKPETLKVIEENLGKSLEDMGTGEKFLNRTAMVCAVRSRIDKWDLIKLKSFCKVKNNVNRTKQQSTDRKKKYQPHFQ